MRTTVTLDDDLLEAAHHPAQLGGSDPAAATPLRRKSLAKASQRSAAR
jgi:hypothetical protein